MKRLRLVPTTALAAAALGAVAPPASAEPVCHPDGICFDCSDERLQVVWRKVFGNGAECE